MKLVQHIGMVAILGALAAFGLGSCASDDNNRPESNQDGGDTNPLDNTIQVPGINIMPDETGWLAAETNELGLQGAWYTFACKAEDGCDPVTMNLNPPEGATFTNTGKMCFSGTAPQVTDFNQDGSLDYSTIWGAGMGCDLCAEGGESTTKYTLSTCPYNKLVGTTLDLKIIGAAVRLSGSVSASELRIQFDEGLGVNAAYVKVMPSQVAAGETVSALFADAAVDYDPRPEGMTPAAVQAIQFQIPTNDQGPVSWDFCVEDLGILTN
jgi:hypothetical protein